MYDPILGRFTTIDPLTENYNNQSSYLYAYNNPIRFTDYRGLGGQDEVKDEDDDEEDELEKLLRLIRERNIEYKEYDDSNVDQAIADFDNTGEIVAGQGGGNNYATAVAVTLTAESLAPGWGVALIEPTPVGEIVMGAATLVATTVFLLSHKKNRLNPNLDGTSTSRGNPTDWNFDPEIKRLQNDKYYPPYNKPPWWFWPAVGAAGAYELYQIWPKPNIIQPTTPVDKTYIAPKPIHPYFYEKHNKY